MRQEVALGLAKGDWFALRQYKDDSIDRENHVLPCNRHQKQLRIIYLHRVTRLPENSSLSANVYFIIYSCESVCY